jgi:hypothetical protein
MVLASSSIHATDLLHQQQHRRDECLLGQSLSLGDIILAQTEMLEDDDHQFTRDKTPKADHLQGRSGPFCPSGQATE